MSGPETTEVARAALGRMAALLTVLDREHTAAELYSNLRGVRHELLTAQEALRGSESASGSSPVDEWPPGLEAPSWGARRALQTRPGSQRHRALRVVSDSRLGLADWELADRLLISVHQARCLRWEMLAAGWVGKMLAPSIVHGDGRVTAWLRRNPETGRSCVAWVATVLGREYLGRLDAGQMTLSFPEAGVTGSTIPLDTP